MGQALFHQHRVQAGSGGTFQSNAIIEIKPNWALQDICKCEPNENGFKTVLMNRANCKDGSEEPREQKTKINVKAVIGAVDFAIQ